VGTRHVKVWRIEDSPNPTSSKRLAFDGIPLSAPVNPATRTLAGRNCLLGVLVDATFSCASSLSDNIAVVCTERGDILCLRDDGDGQRLLKAGHAGFSITCIAIDPRQQLVCVGGRAGLIKELRFEDLLRPSNKFELRSEQNQSLRNIQDHMGLRSHNPATFCAMAFVADVRVAVDSQHAITISKKGATQSSHPLSSHRDPVLGVGILSQPNHFDSVFFTWTSVGEVRLWDLQGRSKFTIQIELDQSLSSENDESINQCRVVRTSEKGDILVSGDKYGVLRVLGSPTLENCIFTTKAHSSDIQDIAIYEGDRGPLIVSCGRDRTVQLFRKLSGMWLLVQTMDEHTAAVSSLLFCQEGEKVMLLSSSTDRTIQIRQLASREMSGQEIIAAIPVKIITLKSSPLSMALSPNDQISTFVVSLLDRTVVTYDILGKLVRSFRATDNDGNDAVVMDALVVSKRRSIPGRPTILAGVSSTDKSIRLYDRTTGAILNREFGHIGSVTGMTLLETESEESTIISTSVDGTIMIWNLSFREHGLQESSETANESVDQSLKDVPTIRPPLRRVLSKVELAEFQRLSPISTTGQSSPPRALRRKASKYSMPTQSPKLAVSSVPSNYSSVSQDFDTRESPRTQSRSPPLSPKSRITRRPSLASLGSRGRTRSTGNVSEFGSLNMATEQVCRTLRAYRKKIGSAEPVREEVLKELDRELRETARAVGERTLRNKAVNETVLAGLLDQYSERLVSIFDEKVRLSLNANALSETGPAINGKLCVSTTRNATSRLDQSLV
jgi:WD40 repeat protein